MDKSDQVLEELLLNDEFIGWVLDPNPTLNQYWQQWQSDHPDRKMIVLEARRLVYQMNANGQNKPLHEQEVQQMWQALQNRHTENYTKNDKRLQTRWYWIAASISILLVLGVLLVTRINEPVIITHQTTYGETRYVVLPDSSSVLLNANSSIAYQEDWLQATERKVTLTGEAFFDVHHTKDHRRFFVHANAVTVEVLGTSFNVLNRRDRTQVVLKEGEVKLRAVRSEILQSDITMHPGELVAIEGSNCIQHPVSVEYYTAWMQDEHIFDGTTIAEIAQLIEDIYGIEVRVANKSLLHKKFTGRVDRGDLNGLFGQLEKVFQLSIEQKEQLVIIQ
ncbi:MAG: FecR domain-containing protein [Bacteroidota bacterium]